MEARTSLGSLQKLGGAPGQFKGALSSRHPLIESKRLLDSWLVKSLNHIESRYLPLFTVWNVTYLGAFFLLTIQPIAVTSPVTLLVTGTHKKELTGQGICLKISWLWRSVSPSLIIGCLVCITVAKLFSLACNCKGLVLNGWMPNLIYFCVFFKILVPHRNIKFLLLSSQIYMCLDFYFNNRNFCISIYISNFYILKYKHN